MTNTGETFSATSTAVAPLYELRGVERTFSKGSISVQALRGVDIDIASGEHLALQGPSGSGKSTLLQLLGALDVPTKGTIRFGARELGGANDDVLTKIRLEEIGFVFQNFNLIPTLTAAENVAIAMVPRMRSHRDRIAKGRELLERVGLGERADHLPSRLSGGEQQRVAIARALANDPHVVIADEPTGNLDSDNAAEVMSLLTTLESAFGVTVILATHDDDIAARMSRRIRLRDGSITEDVRS